LLSSRYNVLGDIILTNGATLTQRVTDGPGTFEGFQFRGNIFVGGNAASFISASTPDSATTTLRANHLGPNTTFTVADVTGNANVDLTVTAVLRDQSGDFALGPGALTKAGVGTMLLNAANTYSGGTTVSAGTLRFGDDAALGATTGSLTLNGGTLDLNGHSVSISAFNGAGGAVLASSGAATLNIDHSTLSTFTGSLNDGGATLSVTKNGSGIQNLSGAN
jgi:fibronectin-binding autotransporter adhesin